MRVRPSYLWTVVGALAIAACDGSSSVDTTQFIDAPAPQPTPVGRRSSLSGALELGARLCAELQIPTINGGAHQPPEAGRKSLRSLVFNTNGELALSSAWRAMQIYQLSVRYPEVANYTHLGVGHFSVILGAPREDQLHLMRWAELKHCSRRQLARMISGSRQTQLAS